MIGWQHAIFALALLAVGDFATAQTQDRMIGGDVLRTGNMSTPLQASRDVVAMGATVVIDGNVAQDTQAAGFDVDVDAKTEGDLTALGFSVGLRGPVGGDLTASGLNLRTGPGAEVAGNARLAGARVTVDGPVKGALVAVGGEVALNTDVAGDALLMGQSLTFGPGARIGGTLTYSAPERIEIPATVVSADRIIYEPYKRSEMMADMRDMWSSREYPVFPTFLSVFSGFVITLGSFVVIGALFLTLAPTRVRRLQRSIEARPGMSLLTGTIGLSVLFGMVPISALSIVGLPLVPIVILAILCVWTLGYILGAYVLALRVMRGLGAEEDPAIWTRLLALVIGVTLVALLNFIPVVGWMANYALVLLGVGGMTTAVFEWLVGNAGPALDVDMQPINPKA